MELTIKKIGFNKYSYYRLMNGNEEFCNTRKFETAILIQNEFKNIVEIQNDNSKSINFILDKINELTGIDLTKNLSKDRITSNVRLIYYHIAEEAGHSLRSIVEPINRNHATLINMRSKFENYYSTEKEFRLLYKKINNQIFYE